MCISMFLLFILCSATCIYILLLDTNECTLGTDNCDANAACADTEGSFTCTCNPGYEGDGVTCQSKNTVCFNNYAYNHTCIIWQLTQMSAFLVWTTAIAMHFALTL